MTSLRRFLALLERGRAPTLLTRALEAQLGRELVTSLRAAGVLVRGDPATRYPCGGPDGDGCPRRVVANPGCEEHPFVAVCGQAPPECDPVFLAPHDIEQTAISEAGLVRVLRRLLGVEDAPAPDGSAYPDTLFLGRTARDGTVREAFLSLRPWDAGFPTFLAARRATRTAALVLVPTPQAVSVALADAHGPGERVELAFLADVLAMRDGALVWADAANSAPVATPRPVCVALTPEGRRELTEREYHELRARAAELDLFLDLTVAVAAGAHPGSRREEDGTQHAVVLTAHEAAAFAELVERRAPARAKQLRALNGVNHPDKLVERTRRKLDVKLSRYEWRALHTLRADDPAAKSFVFNPPATLRFLVLAPVR